VDSDLDQFKWISRTKLLDSKEDILDLKFAPKHLGLQLAVASDDGCIRIYESKDLMNLSDWDYKTKIQASTRGIQTLSWNKSSFDPPMLALGLSRNQPS